MLGPAFGNGRFFYTGFLLALIGSVHAGGALGLKEVPKRMLILGGGIIGLEMGTVYSTLGARLDVVEMLDGLMQGAGRDLVKIWQKTNAKRFDNIMLTTKTVGAKATPAGIEITCQVQPLSGKPQKIFPGVW